MLEISYYHYFELSLVYQLHELVHNDIYHLVQKPILKLESKCLVLILLFLCYYILLQDLEIPYLFVLQAIFLI